MTCCVMYAFQEEVPWRMFETTNSFAEKRKVNKFTLENSFAGFIDVELYVRGIFLEGQFLSPSSHAVALVSFSVSTSHPPVIIAVSAALSELSCVILTSVQASFLLWLALTL